MKYIKRFNENKNIQEVCGKYEIENWSVVDGKVNVNGYVNLSFKNLTSLDIFDGITFGEVTGNFLCLGNDLTSLEGSPTYIGGDFSCNHNNLTSLVGAPNNVNENFNCSYNELTSLEGAPKIVGGSFYCINNQLISLEGAPTNVVENFNCNHNNLSSLKYAPKTIGGQFSCTNNNILDFKYLPNVDGNLYLNNQLKCIYDNFIKTKDNIELFNEFDIIRDNVINLKRLNKFIRQYGGNELDTNKLEELGYKLA